MYSLIYIYLIFISLKSKLLNKILFYLICFFMFLFLDSSVGTDSIVYSRVFDEISSKMTFDLIRSGYLLRVLFFILKNLGLDFLQTKIIVTFIFFTGIFYCVDKLFKKENQLQILFILFVNGFLLQYSLNTIKQGLSIVFLYLVFIYLEKSKIKTCIYSIIAILFHSTSIIGLFIIVFLKKIKIKLKIYCILFVFSYFLGQYLNEMVNFMLISLNLKYYTRYFVQNVGGVTYNIFNIFEYQVLLVSLLILDYKNKIRLTRKQQYLKNIFYIEILIVNLFVMHKQLISRITSYFSLINAFILVCIINQIKNKNIRLFVYMFISILFFYIRIIRVSSLDYKSWLFL